MILIFRYSEQMQYIIENDPEKGSYKLQLTYKDEIYSDRLPGENNKYSE